MTTKIADAQNFLDVNGLNSIRLQSKSDDKESKEVGLQSAAKQFEAIFMQMLLKSMRSAQEVLESDSPFNSESTKFYRDMHDQQMSLELSNNGSLGLSELIVRQLGGDSENFTPKSVLRSDGNIDSRGKNVLYNSVKENTLISSLSKLPRQKNDFVTQLSHQMPAKSDPVFEHPKDFVSAITESAKKVQQKLNIPFEVVIAQAALETGWGQKIIQTDKGQSSHNLFNIKADARWQGEKTNKETLEFEQGAMVKKREPFRVYSSISASINDYISHLSSNDRYKSALDTPKNVEHFLHSLQKAGYATDPNYAKKIMGTLRTVTSLLNK